MAFAGEEFDPVEDVEAGEQATERVGLGDGDDDVLLAMEDEGRWEGCGSGGGVGCGETAGDLDDGANAVPVREGGVGECEKGSERDAKQGDAARMDHGTRGEGRDGVGDGIEPERDVMAIEDRHGVGTVGPGAVEVVDGVESDAETGDERGEAVEQKAMLPPAPCSRRMAGKGPGPSGSR